MAGMADAIRIRNVDAVSIKILSHYQHVKKKETKKQQQINLEVTKQTNNLAFCIKVRY